MISLKFHRKTALIKVQIRLYHVYIIANKFMKLKTNPARIIEVVIYRAIEKIKYWIQITIFIGTGLDNSKTLILLANDFDLDAAQI